MVAAPSSGAFQHDPASGGFQYQPNQNFCGGDSFQFTVSDGVSDSPPATDSLVVACVNDPPSASDDTASVLAGSASTTVSVLANDSVAPDTGETLTVSSVQDPANGSATVAVGGTAVIYQPDASYAGGADSFSYDVSDGNGGTALATITVTVTSATDLSVTVVVVQDGTTTADVPAGQPFSYVATITNNGPVAATGIQLTASAAADLEVIPDDPPPPELIKIAEEGEEAPDGLGPFDGIGQISLDEDGHFAFRGLPGVYVGEIEDLSTTTLRYGLTTPIPGGSGNFLTFTTPTVSEEMSPSGQEAPAGRSACTPTWAERW